MRLAVALLAVSLCPVAAAVSVADRPSLGACLSKSPRGQLAACFDDALGRSTPTAELVPALGRLLDEEPDTVAAVAKRAAERPGLPPGERAALKDLEGQALLELGRAEEAASALEAALALDDGASRLVWRRAMGEAPVWTAALDVGSGRLERAARAYLAADWRDRARETLARAIRLGGSDWARNEGWSRAGGGTLPGLSGEPEAILVEREFPRLPSLALGLLDGGVISVVPARGKAVLLDFWASWCPPCMVELPKIQALYEAERERGLEVVAINAEEPEELVRRTAGRLGLTLPVARYDAALDAVFKVRVLPTTVLLDREGRVRARWDGYEPGQEALVADKARKLLGDDPEGRPRKIAGIVAGAGRVERAWAREFADAVTGLAVLRSPGGIRIAAAAGRSVSLLDSRGEPSGKVAFSGGRILALHAPRATGPDLAAFRTGGTEIAFLDLDSGRAKTWRAPAPVFDMAAVPAGRKEVALRVALATSTGVHLLDTEAMAASRAGGAGETLSLAVEGGRILALEARGRLLALDGSGHLLEETDVGPAAARLVPSGPASAGFGVGPSWIAASAAGRFLGGADFQIAAATVGGQLVLLDAASGEELVRAEWPGISALAAADLDGDGAEELLVASDRFVAALRCAANPEGAGAPVETDETEGRSAAGEPPARAGRTLARGETGQAEAHRSPRFSRDAAGEPGK